MVKSYSGPHPHLVTHKRTGQYNVCDSMCPNCRSLGICAHSVAATEDNKELQGSVQWYSKAKKVPNITKLATAEMPAGWGHKGFKAPPKKKQMVQPDSRVPYIVAGVQSKESSHSASTSISSSTSLNFSEKSQAALSSSTEGQLSNWYIK